MNDQKRNDLARSTNHVCHIHWNPPEISVEARLSAAKWARSPRPTTLPFPKSMEVDIRFTRPDLGLRGNSVTTGDTSMMDSSGTRTGATRHKSAGEVFPSR